MNDITAIYYTANRIPDFFAHNVRMHLLETTMTLDIPVISVSQKPLSDVKNNICIGFTDMSIWNLYLQILTGAQAADTEYIALCEDDCLYTPSHFIEHRPLKDIDISFNRNRWNCRTWHPPMLFSYRNRSVMNQIIARRDSFIAALKERLALKDISRTPHQEWRLSCYLGEPGRYDKALRITIRQVDTFNSTDPSIVFDHLWGLQSLGIGTRKKPGPIREPELPYWGPASALVEKFLKE
jgi:hypothetical protein